MKRLLGALLAGLVAGAAWAQNTNDPRYPSGPMPQGGPSEERGPRYGAELAVALPAWPKAQDLIEFRVASIPSFRFFVDGASLSIGSDQIMRYTLLARSASGVENVSYEGMRCADGLLRIYAYGRDGRWQAQSADRLASGSKDLQRWQRELRSRYFCPNGDIVQSAAEGLDALRRGGHPSVDGQMRLGR